MVPTKYVLLLFLTAIILAGSIILVKPAFSGENTGLDPIHFSQDSLVTRQPFRLTLTSRAGGTIRYTTNGSLPTAASPVYAEPISIEQPAVIQAQLFDETDQPVGNVYTRSYLIADYEQTLPVVSIVTDWAYLYWLHDYPLEHNENGVRPAAMEYFGPDGRSQFNVIAGIQIDESDPLILSLKKSYRLNFQPDGLAYQLFADSAATTFNTLLLRAAFSDNFPYHDVRIDQPHTCITQSIGDQVIRNLSRDAPHGQWVLLYLNGKYWGLYNLVEQAGKPETELGQFSTEQVKAEILRQAAMVRPFVPMEAERWASGLSRALFDQRIQEVLTFVDERAGGLDKLSFQTFADCQ